MPKIRAMKTIYDIYAQEKKALQSEDIEQAFALAQKREEVIKEVLQSDRGQLEKIIHLREENKKLIALAKELQKKIKEELKKVSQENKRFLGYKEASKVKSIYGQYLNKRG